MKLFFLMIPLIGINCMANCLHARKTERVVPRKESVASFPLPTGLLVQFN